MTYEAFIMDVLEKIIRIQGFALMMVVVIPALQHIQAFSERPLSMLIRCASGRFLYEI